MPSGAAASAGAGAGADAGGGDERCASNAAKLSCCVLASLRRRVADSPRDGSSSVAASSRGGSFHISARLEVFFTTVEVIEAGRAAALPAVMSEASLPARLPRRDGSGDGAAEGSKRREGRCFPPRIRASRA